MRTAMRPRYYCDHCNKGNGSPSAMRRHESGCTKNPARICRMCALVEDEGGSPQTPRADLLRTLDEKGFPAMCEAANECPACILSVVRERSTYDPETGPSVAGPEDGRQVWQYATAKLAWWKEFNSSRDPGIY